MIIDNNNDYDNDNNDDGGDDDDGDDDDDDDDDDGEDDDDDYQRYSLKKHLLCAIKHVRFYSSKVYFFNNAWLSTFYWICLLLDTCLNTRFPLQQNWIQCDNWCKLCNLFTSII